MAKQTINPRRRVVGWLLAVFSGAFVLSAFAATQEWTWVTTGSLNQRARAFHTATLVTLADGSRTVMVVGGLTKKTQTPEEVPTSEILKGKDWTYAQSLKTARQWHTATLRNGLVLVAGGKREEGGQKSLSSCELLDPNQNQGTGKDAGNLKEARDQHTATLFTTGPKAGQVLVVGGEQMSPPNPPTPPVNRNLATCELYDGTMWTTTGNLTEARNLHTATLLGNGRVLVAGGFYMDENNNRIALGSCELYNPETGEWEKGGASSPPLQHPRGDHTATLLADGRILVAGGSQAMGGPPWESYEIYGPDPDHPGQYKWTCPTDAYPNDPSKRLPFPCAQQTDTLLKDGKVLLVAGENSMIYIPDPNGAGGPGDTWTYDYLNYPRFGKPTATRLNNDDGTVLVAGGGPDQCEIWQPRPATLPAGVSRPVKRPRPIN